MEGDLEPPTWISGRVPWLCGPYEALQVAGLITYVSFINNELYHTVHPVIILNYIRNHTNNLLLQIR